MARPQRHALAQRSIRQNLSRRRERACPGQASRTLHRHERYRGRGRGGHPDRIPPASLRDVAQAQGEFERLGQHVLELAGLVPRDLIQRGTPARKKPMDERELRGLIEAVKAGRVSRRAFGRKRVGLGLTAPLAGQLLAHAGLAQAPTRAEYKPTKAGGGGALKTLFWQAPTLLNPHFAVGGKDQEGSRVFYEPLAAWDPEGNLVPVL